MNTPNSIDIYILSIAINNVRMMRLIDIIHNYSLLFFFFYKNKYSYGWRSLIYYCGKRWIRFMYIFSVVRWFTGTSPRPVGRVRYSFIVLLWFTSSINRLHVTFGRWGGCIVFMRGAMKKSRIRKFFWLYGIDCIENRLVTHTNKTPHW